MRRAVCLCPGSSGPDKLPLLWAGAFITVSFASEAGAVSAKVHRTRRKCRTSPCPAILRAHLGLHCRADDDRVVAHAWGLATSLNRMHALKLRLCSVRAIWARSGCGIAQGRAIDLRSKLPNGATMM